MHVNELEHLVGAADGVQGSGGERSAHLLGDVASADLVAQLLDGFRALSLMNNHCFLNRLRLCVLLLLLLVLLDCCSCLASLRTIGLCATANRRVN